MADPGLERWGMEDEIDYGEEPLEEPETPKAMPTAVEEQVQLAVKAPSGRPVLVGSKIDLSGKGEKGEGRSKRRHAEGSFRREEDGGGRERREFEVNEKGAREKKGGRERREERRGGERRDDDRREGDREKKHRHKTKSRADEHSLPGGLTKMHRI
jgi:hypothetical protein